jgi:hypothetical protein
VRLQGGGGFGEVQAIAAKLAHLLGQPRRLSGSELNPARTASSQRQALCADATPKKVFQL